MSELDWSEHINQVSSRSNSTLGLLRRNLRYGPQALKETAYFSLVRSVLEYSCTIWDTHWLKDVNKLEMVQRRAARFMNNKYKWNDGSVIIMLRDLKWTNLRDRRRELRLALFYKVVHHLIAVPSSDILTLQTRSRAHHHQSYKHITTSTTNFSESFFPRTVPEWNRLPKKVVNCTTIYSFKANLKKLD